MPSAATMAAVCEMPAGAVRAAENRLRVAHARLENRGGFLIIDGDTPLHRLTLHQPARSWSRSLTLGSSKLGLDGLFKGVLRQVAAEHAAVDEESRSAGESGPQPQLQVLFNLRLVPAAGQARIKLFLIELQTAGLLH